MRKTLKTLAITTLSLTMVLPLTAYASQWTQDTAGWKVQSDDGTYLTSQWYQSPESGLWYYIGADSYMLTNTTTPDGFYVNADGVWTEPVQTQPQVTEPAPQPTQQNNSGGIDTSGWDLGGGTAETKPLSDNPTYSDEELKGINEIEFN